MARWAVPHRGPPLGLDHKEEKWSARKVGSEPQMGENRGGKLTMEKGIWPVRKAWTRCEAFL
jgi:hypothetical protein